MAWGVYDYPEPSLKYQRDHDGGYEWDDDPDSWESFYARFDEDEEEDEDSLLYED